MCLFQFVFGEQLGAPGLDFETGGTQDSTYGFIASANTCCAAATACP